MDHISQYASLHFAKYGMKLRHCTKFKKVVQKNTSDMKYEAKIIEEGFLKKLRKHIYLKDMSLSFSMPQGWCQFFLDFG